MDFDLSGINEIASVGWAILKVALLMFATILTGVATVACTERLITGIKRVLGG
jgi:hypothetical protein